MARKSVVTTKDLLKVEGVAEIIGKLEGLLNQTTAKHLKKVYFHGALIVSNEVRKNIQALNASPELKKILTATVVTNEGPEKFSNAISAISQRTAERKLGAKEKGIRVPNPYWFEYGTQPRATAKGAGRGRISETKPGAFFRPAVAAKRDEVKQYLIEQFTDIIDRAAAAKNAGKSPRGAFFDRKTK